MVARLRPSEAKEDAPMQACALLLSRQERSVSIGFNIATVGNIVVI